MANPTEADWEELKTLFNLPDLKFDSDYFNSPLLQGMHDKIVPTPKQRKILKMDKSAVLSFNPNNAVVDQTSEAKQTWCLDPEWMHMSNEFQGVVVDTDYNITNHTATLSIKLPVEFMSQQAVAGQFMADVHNIMAEAESVSDFLAALTVAWMKIEEDA